jgi:serine/threonine-protein kinase
MGRVFVAQKDGSPEICVIKLLNTEQEEDEAGAQRLRREAHLLSLMNHPNISRVLDAGFERGAFFLALEYIPGHTINLIQQELRKRQRRIPPEVVIVVALDVLAGLVYAHDHADPDGQPIHLVHRDLSPNNIMLSYRGEAKIIDFGIASGKIDTFKTKPGHIMGTPRYLSPEQATMKPIDRRSDLYTLSVVLYGMFLGRSLIKKGPPGQVLVDIVEQAPQPLPELIEFPDALWRVLAKGMAKKPNDRFQTAQEYRDAIEAVNTWSLPSRREVGLFLEEYFPEGKKKSDDLSTRGRANAPSVTQPGGFFDTTGADLRPPEKQPITEPELVLDAIRAGTDSATDLIQRAGDAAGDPEGNTAEMPEAMTGELELGREAVMAQTMESGPTVANDPRDFPPGIADEPIERVPPRTSSNAHIRTDPAAAAIRRSRTWLWAVLLALSIALGVGAGLAYNLVEAGAPDSASHP